MVAIRANNDNIVAIEEAGTIIGQACWLEVR